MKRFLAGPFFLLGCLYFCRPPPSPNILLTTGWPSPKHCAALLKHHSLFEEWNSTDILYAAHRVHFQYIDCSGLTYGSSYPRGQVCVYEPLGETKLSRMCISHGAKLGRWKIVDAFTLHRTKKGKEQSCILMAKSNLPAQWHSLVHWSPKLSGKYNK